MKKLTSISHERKPLKKSLSKWLRHGTAHGDKWLLRTLIILFLFSLSPCKVCTYFPSLKIKLAQRSQTKFTGFCMLKQRQTLYMQTEEHFATFSTVKIENFKYCLVESQIWRRFPVNILSVQLTWTFLRQLPIRMSLTKEFLTFLHMTQNDTLTNSFIEAKNWHWDAILFYARTIFIVNNHDGDLQSQASIEDAY